MVIAQEFSSRKLSMTFECNGVTYRVTPETVEEALHLPSLNGVTPDAISDSTLLEFVTNLGYNGEPKKFASLF